MPRIMSLDQLHQLKVELVMKRNQEAESGGVRVTVGMGTCGIAAGAREVMAALMSEIERHGASDVIVTASGCAGLCSQEPMATVELRSSSPVKYVHLTPEKMADVFRRHVLGGEIVAECALAAGCETTA